MLVEVAMAMVVGDWGGEIAGGGIDAFGENFFFLNNGYKSFL